MIDTTTCAVATVGATGHTMMWMGVIRGQLIQLQARQPEVSAAAAAHPPTHSLTITIIQ